MLSLGFLLSLVLLVLIILFAAQGTETKVKKKIKSDLKKIKNQIKGDND